MTTIFVVGELDASGESSVYDFAVFRTLSAAEEAFAALEAEGRWGELVINGFPCTTASNSGRPSLSVARGCDTLTSTDFRSYSRHSVSRARGKTASCVRAQRVYNGCKAMG